MKKLFHTYECKQKQFRAVKIDFFRAFIIHGNQQDQTKLEWIVSIFCGGWEFDVETEWGWFESDDWERRVCWLVESLVVQSIQTQCLEGVSMNSTRYQESPNLPTLS
jgi:hypothetical protein